MTTVGLLLLFSRINNFTHFKGKYESAKITILEMSIKLTNYSLIVLLRGF